MSAQGFKSVFMVAAIAGTALSCYLVSLRVASERAALESVENRIVLAQRDIRLLETEIGTRGRLSQLERWNVKVIRLSAPSADQFVEGAFQLATLAQPERVPALEAPIVLASATVERRATPLVTSDGADAAPRAASRPLGELMRTVSYSKPAPRAVRAALDPRAAKPAPKVRVASATPAGGNAAPAAKPVKIASSDPLAPLSGPAVKAWSDAAGGAPSAAAQRATKDSGSN
ncbi:MAG: hypothetical protein M3Q83_05645 [Pseudomonadota bacterium]|nr:hypothetical protein [Pseudomonadota bacterium]